MYVSTSAPCNVASETRGERDRRLLIIVHRLSIVSEGHGQGGTGGVWLEARRTEVKVNGEQQQVNEPRYAQREGSSEGGAHVFLEFGVRAHTSSFNQI